MHHRTSSSLFMVSAQGADQAKRRELSDTICGLSTDCVVAADNVWLVQSSQSANTIRDEIKKHSQTRVKVVVAQLAGYAAWDGFDAEDTDWLLAHL